MAPADTLGHRLYMERHRQRLSLRDVAKAAGIAISTVSRMENDQEALFWNVVAVARALNVSLDTLTAGLEVPTFCASV